MSEVTEEQMEELFEFLQKKAMPKGFHIEHRPKLTYKQAFAVIYYLQERLRVLPDCFELCKGCGRIYDSEQEGITLNGEDMETTDGTKIPAKHHGCYHTECAPISWRWKG